MMVIYSPVALKDSYPIIVFTHFSIFFFLHIQAICIQQEIVHADDQNAIVGVPGGWSDFHDNKLFEGIIDTEQRIGFLLHFCFVGNSARRLRYEQWGVKTVYCCRNIVPGWP